MIKKDNEGYILYHEMDSVYSVYLDTYSQTTWEVV